MAVEDRYRLHYGDHDGNVIDQSIGLIDGSMKVDRGRDNPNINDYGSANGRRCPVPSKGFRAVNAMSIYTILATATRR